MSGSGHLKSDEPPAPEPAPSTTDTTPPLKYYHWLSRHMARNFPLDVRRALTNCSRNEATLQGIPDLILLQSLTHDPLPPQGATLPSDSDSYSSSSSYASSSSDNSADGAGREASPSLSYRGGGGGDSDGIRKGRKRTKYGVRRRRRKRRRRSSRRCSDPDFLDVVDAEPVDAPAPKPKRRPARRRTRKSVGGGSRRRRTSPAERAMLEKLFKINPWPRSELLNLYAGRLGWTRRSVQIWFQNQRRGFRKAFNDGKITMVNPGNAQFRRSLLPPSLSAVIPAVPDNPVDDGSGDGDGAGAGGVVGAAGAVERDAPPAADTAQDGTGDGGDGATHDEALAAGASDAPSKGGPTDPAAVGDAGDVADAGDVGGDAKDGTDSKKRGRGSQTRRKAHQGGVPILPLAFKSVSDEDFLRFVSHYVEIDAEYQEAKENGFSPPIPVVRLPPDWPVAAIDEADAEEDHDDGVAPADMDADATAVASAEPEEAVVDETPAPTAAVPAPADEPTPTSMEG